MQPHEVASYRCSLLRPHRLQLEIKKWVPCPQPRTLSHTSGIRLADLRVGTIHSLLKTDDQSSIMTSSHNHIAKSQPVDLSCRPSQIKFKPELETVLRTVRS